MLVPFYMHYGSLSWKCSCASIMYMVRGRVLNTNVFFSKGFSYLHHSRGRTVCQFIMATNLQAHPLLYYAALHLITCVEIEI